MQTGAIVAASASALVLAYSASKPQKIGKYYILDDVIRSNRAESLGLMSAQRMISQASIENARRLARHVIEPIIQQLGETPRVTSWYRSKALNERTPGSAQNSKHLTASAVDLEFYYQGQERNDLIVRAALAAANFDRMILEYGTLTRPAWIHIEVAPIGKTPEKKILRYNGTSWQVLDYLAALQLFG